MGLKSQKSNDITLLEYSHSTTKLSYFGSELGGSIVISEKKCLSTEIAVFLKMSTFVFFPLTHFIRIALKVRKHHELLTHRTQFFSQETINWMVDHFRKKTLAFLKMKKKFEI